jgi:hypothetical protein
LGRGHLVRAATGEAARARPLRLGLETTACAERRPSIVCDLARPDEIPERGQRVLGLEPGVEQQVVPEERAPAERGAQPLVDLLLGPVGRGRRAERRCVLAEVERHTVESCTDPNHLAGGAERIQLLRPVPGDAARQDVALPEGDRQSQALERHQRFAQRGAAADPVPAGQEPAQSRLLGRLDLTAERGQGRTPQSSKDFGLAPLALAPTGAKLAAHQLVTALELTQHWLDVAAEALVRVVGRKRAARASEAADERVQRLVVGLEEHLGQAAGRHRADGVAIAAGVLGSDQPPLAGDADVHGATLGQERLGQVLRILVLAQIAAAAEQIVQLVGRAGLAAQPALDFLERAGIDQVAQLLLPEQLAQQVAVERERLRAPLGGRRVVLVHVVGDVVEQQRG